MEAILDAIEERLLKDQQEREEAVKEIWEAEAKARGLQEIPPVPDRLM